MADIARQLDSYARQSQQTGSKLQGLKDEEAGLRQALAAAKAEKVGAQQQVDRTTLQLKALEQEVKQQQLAVNKLQESNDTIRTSIKAARAQQQALTQQRCSEQEAFLVAAKQLDLEVDALLAAAATLKPSSGSMGVVVAGGVLTHLAGSPGATGAVGGVSESDLAEEGMGAGGVSSDAGAGSSLLLGQEEVQLLPGMEGSPQSQSQQQQLMMGALAADAAHGSPEEHLLLAAEAVGVEGGVAGSQGTELAAAGVTQLGSQQQLAAGGGSQGGVGAGKKVLQLQVQLPRDLEEEEDDVCRGSDQQESQVTV